MPDTITTQTVDMQKKLINVQVEEITHLREQLKILTENYTGLQNEYVKLANVLVSELMG